MRVEGYRGALQRGWRGTEGHYSEGGGVQRGVTARVEGVQRDITARVEGYRALQ